MKDLISRFRANIITSGTKAFEEEKWDEISIGSLHFQVSSGKVFYPSLRAANGDGSLVQDGGRWESLLVFDSYLGSLGRRVCDICILQCL